MHTVFRKNGVKVQIPHIKAQEYWIDNVSRTEHEDQQQKTREKEKDAERDQRTTKDGK